MMSDVNSSIAQPTEKYTSPSPNQHPESWQTHRDQSAEVINISVKSMLANHKNNTGKISFTCSSLYDIQ